MTPARLSLFDRIDITQRCIVVFNYKNSRTLFLYFTLVWLGTQCIIYHQCALRPMDLFAPVNWFGIIMPNYPTPFVAYGVICLCVLCVVLQLLRPKLILPKLITIFCLIWINALEWSWGFDSAVNYIFMYAHIFSLFITPDTTKIDEFSHKSILWFHLGILATYGWSGFWKIIGLAVKFFLRKNEISWLHPDAALLNAVVMSRSEDISLDKLWYIPHTTIVWQLGFLFVVIVQTFGWVTIFRPIYLSVAGCCLLMMHMVNEFVFETSFIVASVTLIILYFPYHLVAKNKFRSFLKNQVHSQNQ